MSWNHMLAVWSFMYKIFWQFLPTHMNGRGFWLSFSFGFILKQSLRLGLEHKWLIWEEISEIQGESGERWALKEKKKWAVCCWAFSTVGTELIMLGTLQGSWRCASELHLENGHCSSYSLTLAPGWWKVSPEKIPTNIPRQPCSQAESYIGFLEDKQANK